MRTRFYNAAFREQIVKFSGTIFCFVAGASNLAYRPNDMDLPKDSCCEK